MSGESGSAFQPVYLESVYIAAISSARGSHLLLCKTDIEREIFFLV